MAHKIEELQHRPGEKKIHVVSRYIDASNLNKLSCCVKNTEWYTCSLYNERKNNSENPFNKGYPFE